MRADQGSILLSPSDLTAYLACEHLATLDLRVARGQLAAPDPPEQAELVFEKGLAHEAAYLARLREDGLDVREITIENGYRAAAQRTRDAIAAGVDAIYQAVLLDSRWRGVADFLIRTDEGGYEAGLLQVLGDFDNGRALVWRGSSTCGRWPASGQYSTFGPSMAVHVETSLGWLNPGVYTLRRPSEVLRFQMWRRYPRPHPSTSTPPRSAPAASLSTVACCARSSPRSVQCM